jgi:hypothetical protein
LILFLRRCLLATTGRLATSSPYFLQGTSEKIHFHSFVRKQLLQLEDLLAQHQFPASAKGKICFVNPVSPVVENPASHAEFSRETGDASARIHALNGLLSKFLTVPLTFSLLHFATPFSQSVHHSSVSL